VIPGVADQKSWTARHPKQTQGHLCETNHAVRIWMTLRDGNVSVAMGKLFVGTAERGENGIEIDGENERKNAWNYQPQRNGDVDAAMVTLSGGCAEGEASGSDGESEKEIETA
jgi:hypothetical protein